MKSFLFFIAIIIVLDLTYLAGYKHGYNSKTSASNISQNTRDSIDSLATTLTKYLSESIETYKNLKQNDTIKN